MLSFSALSKTYPNGVEALSRVTADIAPGSIVALVGGSGCGKTTLLRLVSGLETAESGAISLDGAAITQPHPAVGVIFQEPRLFPWLTVAQNIAFGLAGLPRAEQDERVNRALSRIGLDGYGSRLPRELSGGQAQRVAIARALVARPSVLLLDEPFSALDAFTRADLHEQLLMLWAAERPTILMVTHDVEEAVVLADRVLVMQPKPGRIFADMAIDLPRPRDRLSDAFTREKRRVMGALDGSMNTARTTPTAAPIGGYW